MNKKRGCQHGLDHESLPAIRHQTLRTKTAKDRKSLRNPGKRRIRKQTSDSTAVVDGSL